MSTARLAEAFADLPDPRVERTRKHLLGDVLVIAVLAVIAGADGWDDMVEWGVARRTWLRTFLKLPSGIPCADTFRRIFGAIEPTKFASCFESMVAELTGSVLGQLVAIDGKTMRRTFDRKLGWNALHVVTAWVAERGIQLGQVATDAKSNEITAIPRLLDMIDIKGATVSIDAAGCQKKIAEKIIDKEGNYLLALKENQPLLYEEVADYFAHAQQDRTIDAVPLKICETADKAHGRLEMRRVSCTDDLMWMSERKNWKGLKTIVMIERERVVGDKTSSEKAYYLTSHAPDAEQLGDFARRHWSIENELHWTLDVTFDEDGSRIRDRNGAMNLALLRKLALALLKREQSDPRKSLAMKRKRAGWDNDYLVEVLAAAKAAP